MSFINKIKTDGLLSAIGLEISKIPFVKPIISVAASVYPQVKDISVALGLGSATVAVAGNSVEEKVTSLVVAGVTYLVHKVFYLIKDYADNGKIDNSVQK